LPFTEQDKDFVAFVNKALTASAYEITIDQQGKILKVEGTEPIKTLAMQKIAEFQVLEKYQSHKDLLDIFLSDNYLKGLSRFLSGMHGTSADTLMVQQNDTIRLKKQISGNSKEGLLRAYLLDSARNNYNTSTKKKSRMREVEKWSLLPYKQKTNTALYTEAINALEYNDKYHSPIARFSRAIEDLADYHHKNKGKQGLDEEIMSKLDSMGKGFKQDDPEYMAAKLNILAFAGDGYFELLQKVPYEYITNGSWVDSKLSYEFNKGNYSNVVTAVRLFFTKLNDGRKYPLNLGNLSDAIQNQYGKYLQNTTDPAAWKLALVQIDSAEKLKIPEVTEFLAGLKMYCRTRLAGNQDDLSEIINARGNTFYDRAGRYRLLIYDDLVKKKVPDSITSTYLDYTIEMVKNNIAQIKRGTSDPGDKFRYEYEFPPRIPVYHKYLADAYYRKSLMVKDKSIAYLQMSAQYMPAPEELVQSEHLLKSEYDFLPFVQYTDLYLAAAGGGKSDTEDLLKKYAETVIIEPERYGTLKERYLKAYPQGDFKTFFKKMLKEKLPATPAFVLNDRKGKSLSTKQEEDKFIFIDFWGTWCGSCIAEIHKIDELHLGNPKPEKLLVTTIACYDKEKNVDDFMTKEKYSYQVLMSDSKVEKDFNIRSYPTKLLLLPQGVYLTIPFFSDYKAILNRYLEWDI